MPSQTTTPSRSLSPFSATPLRDSIVNRLGLSVMVFAGVAMAALLCSCDRNDQARATPPPKQKAVAPPLAPRFKAACSKIIAGKYDEAAADFAQINVENDPSQPLYDWIMVQQGLALMLAGKDDEARKLFGKLEDAGPFSTEEDDRKLAKFFVSLSHSLRNEEPIPVDAGKDFDKWTYEAFGLLFAGLKDWSLDKYDDALPLLRQFFSASPKGPALWIGDEDYVTKLKEMAGSFAEDYTQFHEAGETLAKAKSPEEKKDAIDAAKTLRAQMKYPSKLTRSLDATIADLQPKVMAAVHENERLSAEAEAADSKAFATAKEKGDALMKEYRFTDAKEAYKDPDLKQQDRIDQQNAYIKKAQWLISFKTNLIKELAKTPYTGPLKAAATGAPIAGSVVGADDEQLQLKTARGGVFPAQWTEISPDSIFDMAKSFIHPDTPPDIAAFRKWQLGVFAAQYGKKEAAKLLKEAAELRPTFEPELALFKDSGGK
jgi:tetratricopeptide (TPR) repeat protein